MLDVRVEKFTKVFVSHLPIFRQRYPWAATGFRLACRNAQTVLR
jgi:hypothetical protein